MELQLEILKRKEESRDLLEKAKALIPATGFTREEVCDLLDMVLRALWDCAEAFVDDGED